MIIGIQKKTNNIGLNSTGTKRLECNANKLFKALNIDQPYLNKNSNTSKGSTKKAFKRQIWNERVSILNYFITSS